MALETTVAGLDHIYEATRRTLARPPSYSAALPGMLAQATPVLDKYAEQLVSKLAFKAPDNFQVLLPVVLENAKKIISGGYTPREAAYLAITISPEELTNLEGWMEHWLEQTGAYPDKETIETVANMVFVRVIPIKPKTRTAFINRCKESTKSHAESYKLANLTHPDLAMTIASFAFYRQDHLAAVRWLTHNYDELVRTYKETAPEIAKVIAMKSFMVEPPKHLETARRFYDKFKAMVDEYSTAHGKKARVIAEMAFKFEDEKARERAAAFAKMSDELAAMMRSENVDDEDLAQVLLKRMLTTRKGDGVVQRYLQAYKQIREKYDAELLDISAPLALACMHENSPVSMANGTVERIRRMDGASIKEAFSQLTYRDGAGYLMLKSRDEFDKIRSKNYQARINKRSAEKFETLVQMVRQEGLPDARLETILASKARSTDHPANNIRRNVREYAVLRQRYDALFPGISENFVQACMHDDSPMKRADAAAKRMQKREELGLKDPAGTMIYVDKAGFARFRPDAELDAEENKAIEKKKLLSALSVEATAFYEGDMWVKSRGNWIFIEGRSSFRTYTVASTDLSMQLEAKVKHTKNLLGLLEQRLKAMQAARPT